MHSSCVHYHKTTPPCELFGFILDLPPCSIDNPNLVALSLFKKFCMQNHSILRIEICFSEVQCHWASQWDFSGRCMLSGAHSFLLLSHCLLCGYNGDYITGTHWRRFRPFPVFCITSKSDMSNSDQFGCEYMFPFLSVSYWVVMVNACLNLGTWGTVSRARTILKSPALQPCLSDSIFPHTC